MLIGRCYALNKKGSFAEAIESCSAALRLVSNYAAPYNNRCLARATVGRNDGGAPGLQCRPGVEARHAGIPGQSRPRLFQRGQFDLAIKDYDEALRLKPGYVDAYLGRGWAYAGEGHFDLALKDYDAVRTARARLGLRAEGALPHLAPGRPVQGCDSRLQQIHRPEPDHAVTYETRGFAYLRDRNPKQARKDFDKALKLDPNSPRLALRPWHDEGASGRPRGGEARWRGRPGHHAGRRDYLPSIRFLPGKRAAGGRGFPQLPRAGTLGQDALRGVIVFVAGERMRNACLGLLLGLCLMAAIPAWAEDVLVNGCREEDDPHIRLAYCTKLIESGKSVEEAKAWAAIARGDAYLDDEEYEQAIASYNDAIRLKPGDDEAWNDRGIAYQYSGEADKAINDYDTAIRLNPKNPLAFNNRGWAYRGKGKYDQALQDLDMAIRLEPDYARAYLNRASVYTETSRHEKALADYTAALNLRPDSPTYLNAHCWGLLAVHRAREALPECNRSLSLRPNSAETLDSRGYAYLQLGDLPAAIADFTHALKLDSKMTSSLYGRAVAKERSGDKAGAERDYAAAREQDSDIKAEMVAQNVLP